MDATKRLMTAILAAGIGGFIAACASGGPAKSADYASFSEHQKVLESCLDSLDSSVRSSLGTPPQFTDLRDAVSWTREHLPTDIQTAFSKAGQLAIKDAQPNGLQVLAKDKAQLNKMLYRVTSEELGALPKYQQQGCDIVVPEKLSNVVDLVLNLSQGPLKKNFEQLGLNDSYAIENAYLLMLTLDASGTEWDQTWFSKS